MRVLLQAFAVAATMGLVAADPAIGQETHVVRLIANVSKDEYRFEPAAVTVRPNDVVVFRVTSGAPHSIVFEGAGLSPDVREAFDAAMPDRSAELSSPLLTATGKEYRLLVPRVPAGAYPFYCLPHRAYDMRGTMTIR
jgi:plastocyanin